MNAVEFAKMLDGRQYGHEITVAEAALAKEHNLVVVFGASDDLMELRGAVDEEIDCYDGGSSFLTADGDLFNEDEHEYCGKCKYYLAVKAQTHELKALWDENDLGASWTYEIDVPFSTFNIMEDDELYCVGIVFSMDDIAKPKA